jgi:serine/threonine protein kinase
VQCTGGVFDCLDWVCTQVMSLRRGVELALDAARGLAYMHNRKPAPIVHRDLKPANLMISGALTQVRARYHPRYAQSRKGWSMSPQPVGMLTLQPAACMHVQ